MAKIRKRKLRWTGSGSPQVVGYKLYWEVGDKVSYNSSCALLGNATEVILPDDVDSFKPESGPVDFGIAAVDEMGNESDLVTISAPYQFIVPEAPEEIWLENPENPTGQALDEITAVVEAEEEPLMVEDPDKNPLAFLDQEFDDEADAIIHRLPENVVGNHSSESQHNISLALKRRVDKL